MEIQWNRLDREAWNAALPDTATALQHSWRYGAAATALGRRVERAEIWRDGRFLGLAQILVRRAGPVTLGLLPRGPVWLTPAPVDAAQGLEELRRHLPGQGLHLLIAAQFGNAALPLMTSVHAALLPLSASQKEMRARMHGKWRNSLTRSECARLKLAVTVPTSADLAALHARDRAQAKSRGYRGLPPAFLAAWADTKGPSLRLYTARAGGEVIAAMLFLDHAPGVTYHLGWSGEEGRRASAHHRLLWQAMRDFARMGRLQIDLGPLDTVNAPGLARFKLGAGATATDLGATGLILPTLPLSRWRRSLSRRNVPGNVKPVD